MACNPNVWPTTAGPSLYGYALSRLQDPSTAEDLVQDTYLAALGSDFKGQSSIKTWLAGVLRHKIADHFRRQAKVPRPPEPDPQPTPYQELRQKQFLETFTGCLAEIPEQYACAFILREIEGLSTKELCLELNTTPGNSWVMIHRARLRLRQCLVAKWGKEL